MKAYQRNSGCQFDLDGIVNNLIYQSSNLEKGWVSQLMKKRTFETKGGVNVIKYNLSDDDHRSAAFVYIVIGEFRSLKQFQ